MFADPRVLRTLIRNLLSNAIKFTKNGGLVKISASNKGDGAEISVMDNGIGMDSKVVENLLNPDFHTSTPGTNNEKGTGLGLRFCKQAVEKHNGTFKVESKPGIGSTFSFTLPDKVENSG